MSESPKPLRAKVIFVHRGGEKWGYYHNAFSEPGVRVADECQLWHTSQRVFFLRSSSTVALSLIISWLIELVHRKQNM